MPQEIEVWYVLPALRKAIAKELKEQGLSQTKIASLLNVTKAAISQYFKNSRASNIDLTPIHKEIVDASTRIKNNSNTVKELNQLLDLVRRTKLICEIHRGCSTRVEKNCGACFNE